MRMAVLAALVAALLLSLTAPTSHAAQASRVIDVRLNYVVFTDRVELPRPMSTIAFALPYGLDRYLVSAYVEVDGRAVEATRLGYLPILGRRVVYYNASLGVNASEVVIVTCIVSPARGYARRLTLPLAPLLPFKLDRCEALLLLPPEARNATIYEPRSPVEEVDGRLAAHFNLTGLDPLSTITLNATVTVTEDWGRVVARSSKLVELADGRVRVVERVTFTGMEANGRVYLLRVKLPRSVEYVEVSDFIGPYRFRGRVGPWDVASYSIQLLEDYTVLTIRPRFSIGYRENETITLTYEAPLNSTIPLLSFQDYPLTELEVTISAPRGSKLELKPPAPITADGRVEATYSLHVYPPPFKYVAVSYTPPPPSPAIPIPPIILVAALVASLAALLKLKAPPRPPPERPSLAPLIQAYAVRVELYARRRALLRDLSEGRVRRREYERRLRAINAELARVTGEIARLRREVKVEEPIASTLAELDQLSESIEGLESERREVEERFKSGRLTRRDYEAALRGLASKLEELEARARKALDRLRGKGHVGG